MASPVDLIKLTFLENGEHQRIAQFFSSKAGVHLSVAPNMIREDVMDGFKVVLFGDNKGEIDRKTELGYHEAKGSVDDLEEIADMYARRLEGLKVGQSIDEIFNDEEGRSLAEGLEVTEGQRK